MVIRDKNMAIILVENTTATYKALLYFIAQAKIHLLRIKVEPIVFGLRLAKHPVQTDKCV